MKKTFTKQEIRDLLNKVIMDEVGFTRMVEILNERVSERVSEAEKPCVEDIPKRKFKVGDKVRIKNGVSSKTHHNIRPVFMEEMDDLIGKTMTVSGYTHKSGYLVCNESGYGFHEDWLEPYKELKMEIEELIDLVDGLVKDEVLFVTSVDWDTSDKTMEIAVKFAMPNPQIYEAFKKLAVIQESQTSSPFEWQWKVHP